jgi:hypothetical protein
MTEEEKFIRDHWLKLRAIANLRDAIRMTEAHLRDGMDPATAFLGHIIYILTIATWAIEEGKIEKPAQVTEAERLEILHNLQRRLNR